MKGPKPKLFSFQDSLPRLPGNTHDLPLSTILIAKTVMDLKESCTRYLKSVRPLATDEEYAHAVSKSFERLRISFFFSFLFFFLPFSYSTGSCGERSRGTRRRWRAIAGSVAGPR